MSPDRQRIVRVAGGRRVQLTPAPGTRPEPIPADESGIAESGIAAAGAESAVGPASGPNDERLRLDVPPHY
ncbi:hypothetical protein [Microbacterium sp.]|uniref:hypothetical protein n=1 Tax=Microbacterium sp. TaxID=51671 RepID=UPI0025DC0FD5|nr:hypothetical protein [Microbacterium sp.]